MFKVFKSSGIETQYSISQNALFHADAWAIYPAKHKQTKRQCSVWVFDKKRWESVMTKIGLLNKNNKSMVMADCEEAVKNYVSSLVKLKHPSILQVLEPLEDHKSRALFVTEYVVNNLTKIDKQELDEIMITKGLLQISQGLKFIHENLHSVHLNIQPSTVFINENFDWKLSGLNFLQDVASGNGELNTFDPRMPSFVNVNYRFSSPNLILNRDLKFTNDLFSLGALIYYLFRSKNNELTPYLLNVENNNLGDYQREVKKLDSISQGHNRSFGKNIPENYLQTFLVLLDYKNTHWDVNHFMESQVFNNELIKILNFFDSILSQPIMEQARFLNNFKNYIEKFSKTLVLNKFLPQLCELLETYTKDPKKIISTEEENLTYVILENLFIISSLKNLSQLTFIERIFPRLNQLIKCEKLLSCKILIINNLDKIENRMKSDKHHEIFGEFLMTLFKDGISISADQQQQQRILFQERVLSNISVFIRFQNYNTISSIMFNDIGQVFSKTTSLKVKKMTVEAFIVMLKDKENSLDSFIVTEKLLPLLQNTSSKVFNNTGFLTKLISLYNEIFQKLTKSSAAKSKQQQQDQDIILEQIFFQLWRLLKFSTDKQTFGYNMSIIDRVEVFLKNKISENLPTLAVAASAAAAGSNNNSNNNSTMNFDEDDEFGDYSTTTPVPAPVASQTPTSIPVTRLQLKPTQPVINPSSNGGGAGGVLTPKTLSFGATTSSSSLSHNLALGSGNNNIKPQTVVQGSNNSGSSGIDWSVESSKQQPMQQRQQFGNNSWMASTTTTATTTTMPGAIAPSTNLPPGFSHMLIQPTKRSATPNTNTNSTSTNINWNSNGDSLI